jgi:hypothetical protein
VAASEGDIVELENFKVISLLDTASAVPSLDIKLLDDISSSFTGAAVTFSLTSSSESVSPETKNSIINIGGIEQVPNVDYTISGSNITFTTPPEAGLSFSGRFFIDNGYLIANPPAAPTSGIGSALSTDTTKVSNVIYKTQYTKTVAAGTSENIEVEDEYGNIAFTLLGQIVVGSGATLRIGTGTTMIMNILNIF